MCLANVGFRATIKTAWMTGMRAETACPYHSIWYQVNQDMQNRTPAVATILTEITGSETVGALDDTKQALHDALRLPDYVPVLMETSDS